MKNALRYLRHWSVFRVRRCHQYPRSADLIASDDLVPVYLQNNFPCTPDSAWNCTDRGEILTRIDELIQLPFILPVVQLSVSAFERE